jgi:hypothetical protein
MNKQTKIALYTMFAMCVFFAYMALNQEGLYAVAWQTMFSFYFLYSASYALFICKIVSKQTMVKILLVTTIGIFYSYVVFLNAIESHIVFSLVFIAAAILIIQIIVMCLAMFTKIKSNKISFWFDLITIGINM